MTGEVPVKMEIESLTTRLGFDVRGRRVIKSKRRQQQRRSILLAAFAHKHEGEDEAEEDLKAGRSSTASELILNGGALPPRDPCARCRDPTEPMTSRTGANLRDLFVPCRRRFSWPTRLRYDDV